MGGIVSVAVNSCCVSAGIPWPGRVYSISCVTHERGSMSFLVSVLLGTSYISFRGQILGFLKICLKQGLNAILELELNLQYSYALVDLFMKVCI